MKEKMDHKSNSQRKEAERDKVLLFEKTIKELKDELLLVQAESNAKDELLAKQAKIAQEAVAGWQKAESEMLTLKQQCKDLVHQKSQISDETKSLEEKLIETNDKVSILTIENKNLYAILDTKETIIKEMNESSDKASLTEMKVRLDATEIENSNLKYELHMAQKELEIRNKERDYNIKTAEAAYKQQMESLKKVSKLEAECNKLRMMLRKRLPGPGAIAKMRNEINNGTETRKRLSNPLVEKLQVIEEENKVLKETLARKSEDTMSCVTESWATTFMSELDLFKEEKLEGPNSGCGFEEDQFQSYPGWLKDIVRVILKKHYVVQMSVNKIIEEVLVALKNSGFYKEGEKDEDKCMVAHKSTEISDKASVVPESGDPCAAEVNSSPQKTCGSDHTNLEVTDKPSEEVESQASNDLEADEIKITNGASNGIENECDKNVDREIDEKDDNFNLEEGSNERELTKGADHLKDNVLEDVKKSFEFVSEPKLESDNTKEEKEQLELESDTTEASKKLAECQEEMQNINKQLQAMSDQKNTNISDQQKNSIPALKLDQKSSSLYQMLTHDSVQKEKLDKKEKLEALTAEKANGEESMRKVSEIDATIKLVPKKPKEGKGLLSRILFGRKQREIKPETES